MGRQHIRSKPSMKRMPARKKKRIPTPPEIVALVLFHSDRTCCVCRIGNKKVQIHHIDDDPSNNSFRNLCVLCFDCHDLTQIKGGFGRRLDSGQVTLYRDNWIETVTQKRASDQVASGKAIRNESFKLEWATSIAEIYREEGRFVELALHFNRLGQTDLRDKYIEEALKNNPSDHEICLLRSVQDRPDLILAAVVKRELKSLKNNPTDRGFLYLRLKRYREVALAWIGDIPKDLEEQNDFAVAYYLKRLVSLGVVDQLFLLALKKAREHSDLWWQVRATEELEWNDELRELLLANAKLIEESDNLQLKQKLATAQGDDRRVIDLGKEIASVGILKSYGSRWRGSQSQLIHPEKESRQIQERVGAGVPRLRSR